MGGGISSRLVPGIPGTSSGAIGVGVLALGIGWLVGRVGAHFSRAFGIAPEFAYTTTIGHGIRPRVLTLSTNVGISLFLLVIREWRV